MERQSEREDARMMREFDRAEARGELMRASPEEEARIRFSLRRFRKDAVISLRINSEDLGDLKAKAKRMRLPYQRIITELIHLFVIARPGAEGVVLGRHADSLANGA